MVRTCFLVPGFNEASGNLDLQPFARSTESNPNSSPCYVSSILARPCAEFEIASHGVNHDLYREGGSSCFGGRWRLLSRFLSRFF